MCVFPPFVSPRAFFCSAFLASRTIANFSFLTSSTEGHDFTEISDAEHTTSGSLIDSNISSGWNIAYTLNEQNICATVALHLAWSIVQRQHVGSIGHRRSQVLSIWCTTVPWSLWHMPQAWRSLPQPPPRRWRASSGRSRLGPERRRPGKYRREWMSHRGRNTWINVLSSGTLKIFTESDYFYESDVSPAGGTVMLSIRGIRKRGKAIV